MDFYQPCQLQMALDCLQKNPDLTILAGGTDVVVHRRAGKIQPTGYLDITRIPNLQSITFDTQLFIGAAVTCATLETNPLIAQHAPLLAAAAACVGSPQIRSRATIGGNVANASPAADMVSALVVLDAKAILVSASGKRMIPVTELICGSSSCALQTGELICGFVCQTIGGFTKWAYDKIGRRNALAISRLNGACTVHFNGEFLTDVHLCIGAVANRPSRLTEIEAYMEGKVPTNELLTRAGQMTEKVLAREIGGRASSSYKLPVSADFTTRLLRNALGGL